MNSVPLNQITSSQALQRLKEGNARFSASLRSEASVPSVQLRKQLVAGQYPFAVILSCSDSRAPSEILFDQGLGDLFVIRVAGNVVAPSLVGSVEFAVASFATELVVVMGHSHCGAVRTTLDVVERGAPVASENIRDIVERIRPGVAGVVKADVPAEQRMKEAVRANVRASVNQLRHGSRILENLIRDKRLVVAGAEYCLETGLVDFFELPPTA